MATEAPVGFAPASDVLWGAWFLAEIQRLGPRMDPVSTLQGCRWDKKRIPEAVRQDARDRQRGRPGESSMIH